jgi:dTDP-4-dehydrorhamnose reductase
MTSRLRILLTGKNGQIGSELAQLLPHLGEFTAVGRNELHFANPDDIRRVVAQTGPNLIINAAAYTAVDQAEKEEPLARAINADAPAIIAEQAKKIGAFLIHYGTDYVFDGAKRSPYSEDDPTNPLGAYGRTKLAGEEAIRASGVPHLILRTAWVYATTGKNFLLTILRLASSREELRIVNDQFGAPTWARPIAHATARLIGAPAGLLTPGIPADSTAELRFPPPDPLAFLTERAGTYHLTSSGVTTWHEFAVAILDAARNIPLGTSWLAAATSGRPFMVKRIIPITTQEYPTPARRPAYSVLSNARFSETFGFSLSDWHSQLAQAISS